MFQIKFGTFGFIWQHCRCTLMTHAHEGWSQRRAVILNRKQQVVSSSESTLQAVAVAECWSRDSKVFLPNCWKGGRSLFQSKKSTAARMKTNISTPQLESGNWAGIFVLLYKYHFFVLLDCSWMAETANITGACLPWCAASRRANSFHCREKCCFWRAKRLQHGIQCAVNFGNDYVCLLPTNFNFWTWAIEKNI